MLQSSQTYKYAKSVTMKKILDKTPKDHRGVHKYLSQIHRHQRSPPMMDLKEISQIDKDLLTFIDSEYNLSYALFWKAEYCE